MAKKDKRIKIFNNINHGVSYSRNYALNRAIGEYIMFVDADDYLSKDWFKIVEKDLDKNFDIVYYCKCEIDYNMPKEKVIEEIMCINGKNNHFAGPISKIFKKEKIGVLGFNDKLINGEDMLFNLEYILKIDNYKISNNSFYNYRIYNGSSTKRFNPKIIESDIEFHKQLERILSHNNISEELKNNIRNYCLKNAVISLVSRFSYIKKYNEAKMFFKVFEDEPYNAIIEKIKFGEVSKKAAFIMLLCRLKLYYILFMILKTYNKIQYKNISSENFLKI